MKKFIYTATALLVLAGSTASAAIITTSISDKTTTQPTQPSPDTNTIPPNCPWNDKNGCGIYN